MKRTQRQYLADLLDAMATAEHFVEGMTLEQLADDRRTQLALERLFGIIGEAAGKVSPELKARYPEVPLVTNGRHA